MQPIVRFTRRYGVSTLLAAVLAAAGFVTTSAVTPTAPDGTAITQDFLGGSGGPITAGEFRLNSTLGQPLAGPPSIAGEVQLFHGVYIPLTTELCRDGDVDLNCSVTPGDALLAFQHFLQEIALTEEQQGHADVDNPQTPPDVTPADALCIFQFFLQEPSCISEFPMGCSDCP